MVRLNQYLILDARKIESILDPELVQCTISSPPYADSKNYGKVDGQIGWGQSHEEYLRDLELVFQKCYFATRDDGCLWIVVNTVKRGGRVRLLPLEIMDALGNIGWIPQDIILWDKVKNLPYSRKGQLRDHFEYVLFLSKSKEFKYNLDRIRQIDSLGNWWTSYPERYHPLGKAPSNVWRIPIPTQGSWGNSAFRHLCLLPPRLVERMLLLTTDEEDVVFDPFAGSGMVLAQAAAMFRMFLGCDINEEYRAAFKSNVMPEVKSLWFSRQNELQSIDNDRRSFSTLVWSLRKLKFTKVLLQRLVEAFGRKKLVCGIMREEEEPEKNGFRLTVILKSGDTAEIREWILDTIKGRPFSRFELAPNLKLVLADESPPADFLQHDERFVYEEGRFFRPPSSYEKSNPDINWQGQFPPIISNTALSFETLSRRIRHSEMPVDG